MKTLQEILAGCAIVAQQLVAYLTSSDGQNARKRVSTKNTEKKLVGADGIERLIVSKPIGAFWEVPAELAETISRAVKALADLKANKYFSFEIGGQTYEIGAVNVNSLTKNHEIWFAKAGLLGSHPVSATDIFSALAKQEVERMVVPVDTTNFQSAVATAKKELVGKDGLPF